MRRSLLLILALRARRHRVPHAFAIVLAADRAGVDPAIALALVERESAFKNVFGHDRVQPPQVCGGPVTRRSYLRYRELRDRGLGTQGVGLTQLTWTSFQDDADQLGGCWKPRVQLRLGFEILASLIDERGLRAGIAAYNGTGPRAERYADDVLRLAERWEQVLTPRPTPRPVPGRQAARS